MYIPAPGDLVFATDCPYEHNSGEVMIYLGETATEWYATNYFDEKIIYTFKKCWFGPRNLSKFDKRRISKRFKHKYKINDIVEVSIKNTFWSGWSHVDNPAKCQILELKLLYYARKKKCNPGYKCRLVNSDAFSPSLVSRIIRYIGSIEEHLLTKPINYNSYWSHE